MKIGYLITARMKSTRLPKKLTLEIQGRQVIRWMIDRLKLARSINMIVLCTSTNPQDDILEEIAIEEDIGVFRGHEDDVIQRLHDAAIVHNLGYILNITADCPLVSLEYIEKIISKYNETSADFIRTLDLPHGFFSYGIKLSALQKVCEIKNDINTEVWGKYFTDTGIFNVVDIEIPEKIKRQDYRLTLDYPEDLVLLKKVYSNFGKDSYKTSMRDIIAFLDNNPQIAEINKFRKEYYQKRWEDQNTFSVK